MPLACEAADLFAGAAPVSFPLNRAGCPSGFPVRSIPVIHFHGFSDEVVPYNGSGEFQSAQASFASWQSTHGCSAPFVQTFPNGDRCETGANCTGGAQAVLCSLSGRHLLYGTQTTTNIAEHALDVMSRGTLR